MYQYTEFDKQFVKQRAAQFRDEFVDELAASDQMRFQLDRVRAGDGRQIADLQVRRHRFDALMKQAVRHRGIEQGGGHAAMQRTRIALPFGLELE